ncbi:MAG: winged helix-turn-helix transcriptional regulator [Gemmatimonadota bacterium]
MTYRNLDRRILRALQEDARRSNRQLARELDVAATTVGNHLADLEERGIVRGYRADIDYRKLGFGLVAVTRIKAKGEALPAIVKSLTEHPSLTHVYEITGEFDVMVIGRFADEQEMNREIKSMLSMSGIEGTNTSIVLDAPKEQLDVGLPVDDEEES